MKHLPDTCSNSATWTNDFDADKSYTMPTTVRRIKFKVFISVQKIMTKTWSKMLVDLVKWAEEKKTIFCGTNLVVAGAVLTRITLAFVHIVFAIDADDAWNANAFVAAGVLVRKRFGENRWQCVSIGQRVQCHVRSLQTFAVVLARWTLALVDVDFAILAHVSNVAIALRNKTRIWFKKEFEIASDRDVPDNRSLCRRTELRSRMAMTNTRRYWFDSRRHWIRCRCSCTEIRPIRLCIGHHVGMAAIHSRRYRFRNCVPSFRWCKYTCNRRCRLCTWIRPSMDCSGIRWYHCRSLCHCSQPDTGIGSRSLCWCKWRCSCTDDSNTRPHRDRTTHPCSRAHSSIWRRPVDWHKCRDRKWSATFGIRRRRFRNWVHSIRWDIGNSIRWCRDCDKSLHSDTVPAHSHRCNYWCDPGKCISHSGRPSAPGNWLRCTFQVVRIVCHRNRAGKCKPNCSDCKCRRWDTCNRPTAERSRCDTAFRWHRAHSIGRRCIAYPGDTHACKPANSRSIHQRNRFGKCIRRRRRLCDRYMCCRVRMAKMRTHRSPARNSNRRNSVDTRICSCRMYRNRSRHSDTDCRCIRRHCSGIMCPSIRCRCNRNGIRPLRRRTDRYFGTVATHNRPNRFRNALQWNLSDTRIRFSCRQPVPCTCRCSNKVHSRTTDAHWSPFRNACQWSRAHNGIGNRLDCLRCRWRHVCTAPIGTAAQCPFRNFCRCIVVCNGIRSCRVVRCMRRAACRDRARNDRPVCARARLDSCTDLASADTVRTPLPVCALSSCWISSRDRAACNRSMWCPEWERPHRCECPDPSRRACCTWHSRWPSACGRRWSSNCPIDTGIRVCAIDCPANRPALEIRCEHSAYSMRS